MLTKSQYGATQFQDRGFVNHIHHVMVDMGVYPGTNNPLIELYKLEMVSNLQSSSGTGAKPRNLALFRKVLSPGASPTSGVWNLLRMWQEGIDYDDASAAGTVSVLPTDGTVHVMLSFGKKDASGAMTYQPWEDFIARTSFAPTVERPSTGVPGPMGPTGPTGPQGPQGVPGPKGDPGTGGGATDSLWEAVRQALKAWLSA